MKRYRWFLMLVLSLFVLSALAGCGTISVDSDAEGAVIYDKYGVSFEDVLTAEEVKAVAAVLDGKSSESFLSGVPSCGFDSNVAIVIDGHRFMLACDKCGTVQDGRTLRYIHISNEEREVLEDIFTSRGGKFPCI